MLTTLFFLVWPLISPTTRVLTVLCCLLNAERPCSSGPQRQTLLSSIHREFLSLLASLPGSPAFADQGQKQISFDRRQLELPATLRLSPLQRRHNVLEQILSVCVLGDQRMAATSVFQFTHHSDWKVQDTREGPRSRQARADVVSAARSRFQMFPSSTAKENDNWAKS